MIFSRLHLEWYDSFARPPQFYNVQLPFGPKTEFRHMNAVTHQTDQSSLCAVFCIYVFYNRIIRNRAYLEIMYCDFSSYDRKGNEARVLHFYNSLCRCRIVRNRGKNCQVCKPRL